MFFENNISLIRKTAPELAGIIMNSKKSSAMEITASKTGMPTMKVDNVLLHSRYDPAKEAEDWVRYHAKDIDSASLIFVMGFGLGYHLLELCQRTDKEIVVFEPRREILKTALESLDLSSILEKIKIVADNEPLLSPLGNWGIKGDEHIAMIQHKPSVSISQEYFEKLLARLESRKRINLGIKVLVVSPIYGGSHPIALYCSSTLKKMGHDVELLDNSRFSDALFFAKDIAKDGRRYSRMIDNLTSFLSEAVMARCETFRPHLVLSLAQAPLTVDCLEYLKNSCIRTAFWFVEDFRLMNYWKNIAGYYDYFFTIQKEGFFDELQKAGVRNYHYLPLAASPEVHKKMEMTNEERKYYGSDISFVGAGYYNRRQLFKGMLDHDFKIWGTDWDMESALARSVQRAGERIETDETVKIFNAAKININLHSSTYHNGTDPYGDFVNPRTFEISSCGAFQLVDRRSELASLFRTGEEIIVFEGLEDLKQKISYYLDHPEEREIIAGKGRQRVLKDHTYEDRMRDMLEYIADNGFLSEIKETEGEPVEKLIEDAGRGSGLAGYLSRYMNKERITLSDIVQDIGNDKGTLDRSEIIFLAMNELTK